VLDAAQPVAKSRVVEPTDAISKERSRAEKAVSDSSSAAPAALYTAQGNVPQLVVRSKSNSAVLAERTVKQEEKQEEPPAEKSEIQKAMELQIKDLLANVWKASAKAVDFLLQRPQPADPADLPVGTLQPAYLLGSEGNKGVGKSAVSSSAQTALSSGSDIFSYSARGGRVSDRSEVAGQLIDVLA
jgi:hypothetical protein